ncbi:MAG TPA: DegT/DnrJ/EryC1/StrS family aminotransferase, partial [Longimicrobiales bacterium]
DLATAAEGADVRVALYDLDPITLAPDYASLGRAPERGARAVVIAHFYGVPVDLEEVQKIAEPYGATVVEDAAQAIGASWRGKPAGSLAPLGVLSFGRGKGLNGGGGGALLLNAASHTTSLGVQARHAGWGELVRASAQWLLARPGIYAVPAAFPFLRLGETIYHEPHPPRALARASTRMLRANWSSAHAEAATRRHNAERLNAAARASAAWQPIRVAPQAQPGYLRLPLIPSSTRDAAVMESGAKLGIMPGYPETLLSLAPFRARCINTADSFPGAEALARNLVTVPTHALLTEDDMQQIEDWLQRR